MGDSEKRYEPAPSFVQNDKDPLLDIPLTDSTELWLIQLPSNQPLDLDGQEVTLKLHGDGKLGDFQSSSGKEYEVVSFASQEPDASVFISSAAESKIVGKISRRVTFLHYPEPSELEKKTSKRQGGMYQQSAGSVSASASRHRYMSRTQGSRQTSASGISHVTATPSRSVGPSTSMFQSGDSSKQPKKRYADELTRSADRSTQDSRGKSDVTQESRGKSDVTLGSVGHPHRGKSKKVKVEE